MKIPGSDRWTDFKRVYQSSDTGLFIGFVNQAQFNELIDDRRSAANHTLFVSQLMSNQEVSTFTNFALSSGRKMSSHTDLAATTLYELGCHTAPHLHTTGQRLQTEKRAWLVTSQNDRVLILHQDMKIEVDSGGNFFIHHLDGTPNNSVELNTSLLAQAIKLLSRFANKQ